MFNKNNLKHILIIALGFLSCSSIYLIESLILKNNSSAELTNEVSVLYGSFAMALGIFLFSIFYKKTKHIKLYYFIFMIFYLISIITFFITKNISLMSSCLCLSCTLGPAGFGAGYHYSLISSNIENKYQGRVYAIGYGLGSILTYLLTLYPNYVSNNVSLIINILVILIIIYLVFNTESLITQEKEKYTSSLKKNLLILLIIIISMATLTAVSQDIIGIYTLNNKNNWFADTRIHYSLGLIIGGIIYDKRKDIFDICLIISFIYPLVSIFLLEQNISLFNISGFSYFFLGFFSVFKALSFISLGTKNKNLICISAYGYMYERIVEGTFMIFQKSLLNNYIVLMMLETIFFAIVLGLYLFFYLNNKQDEDDKLKTLSLKNGLSIQEEKVFKLMMQDLSNQEIADRLYVSINTIRNQVSSIYRKTGMNKKQLREIYHYGTK